MRRRHLLASAAGLVAGPALAATAGCLGAASPHRLLTPIADHEFAVYQPGTVASERAPGPAEPPAVGFGPDASRVLVTGSLRVGSGSCNRAVLRGIRHGADADALRVFVASDEQPGAGDECTTDRSIDSYRLVVTFDDRLPATVTVREGSGPDRNTTTAIRPG